MIFGSGFPRATFSCRVESLERDPTVLPLSPLEPRLRALAEHLGRNGERLPLVIGVAQRGAFRRAVAYWAGGGKQIPVESMRTLMSQVEAWDGTYPDPAEWVQVQEQAQQEAETQVRQLEQRAAQRQQQGLQRQLAAARLRLLWELGRYPVCLGNGTADLNGLLYQQMTRDLASAERLKRCLDRLGGYPEWTPELLRELDAFGRQLPENQRRGRLLGRELDAALDDPRWGTDT